MKTLNTLFIGAILTLLLVSAVYATNLDNLDKKLLVSYSFSENSSTDIENEAPNGVDGFVAAGRTAPTWIDDATGGALMFTKDGAVGDCIDSGVGYGNNYSEITIFVCGINNSAIFGEPGNEDQGGNFMHFFVKPRPENPNPVFPWEHGARIYGNNDGTITFETAPEYYITQESFYGVTHCYAMACGGGQCDAYVDANKVTTLNASSYFDLDTNLFVGCREYRNNQGETINADITEARMYARKLGQEDITELVQTFNITDN